MRSILAGSLLLIASVLQAAITITPDAGILNFSRWEIDDNSNLSIAEITAIVSPLNPLTELYKATPGSGDEGPFAPFYTTTFNADISGGIVDHIGGAFIDAQSIFLLIKDGSEEPAQYIFRISSFTIPGGPWDGVEDIVMSGFWPAQGSISHISIFGGGTRPPGDPPGDDPGDPPAVPEPMSLAIWGAFGIAGLVYNRRRLLAKSC